MRVLSFKQLPVRPPINSTLIWYLFLRQVEAPLWVWGGVGMLFALSWGVLVWQVCTQKMVEIAALSEDPIKRMRAGEPM
jgi:hypothetical protein